MGQPNIRIMNVHIFRIIICVGSLAILVKSRENGCFPSSKATSVTCETTIPVFDKGNNISQLEYINCKTALLTNETFKHLDLLGTLSIHCDFSNNVHLELQQGIFDVVKFTFYFVELHNNNIKSLPDRIFCKLVDVVNIHLSNNTLISIKDVGFGSECGEEALAMKLSFLDLHHNKIKTFHNGTFQRLTTLWILKASSNLLEEIEPAAFEGMSTLWSLDLSNNQLAFFPPQVLRNLSRLNILNLSQNKLNSSTLSKVMYPESLQTLDLSNNRMTSIDATMFQTLRKLNSLHLSYNQIRIIESGFAPMPSLKELYINHSGIEVIKSKAFHGLSSLVILDLSNNKIRKLEPGTFSNISNLPDAQISGDNFQIQKAQTWNLTTLKLARNKIADLNAFSSFHLRKLEELDLSENFIEIIKTETFSNVISTSLNLSHNNIREIEVGAFDNLTLDLSKSFNLNLDNNKLTEIVKIFNTTRLTSISLNYNNLTYFSYSSIPILLQRLSLSHNQISKIFRHSIYGNNVSKFIKLEFMDLSYNQIKIFYGRDFPSGIQNIALHNNLIQRIQKDALNELYNAKNLTLHNNKLEMLCVQYPSIQVKYPLLTTTLSGNPLTCSCELEWLRNEYTYVNSRIWYIKDLRSVKCRSMISRFGTQLQNIDQVSKESMFLCKSTHQHSKKCKCKSSKSCGMSCPQKCSCYRNIAFDFAIVDCFESNFTNMPAFDLHGVPTLYLFADGNNISSINESSFQSYSFIKKIFLNNSQLEKIDGRTFHKLTSLELLQLNHNKLEILSDDIFEGLSNLKELYLANNKLTQLQDEIFSPLKSLLILRLNNNLFVKFPVWELSKLQFLANVGLQQNKWSCDCDYVDKFRTWLQANGKIVDEANNLVCSDQPTGQEFPLISFIEKCHSASPLQLLAKSAPAWGSASGVILLIFLVITFVFIYRREMQVLIYSRYGVRIFSKTADEIDENKLFDAFIAYSCLDEDFIINVLLPGLEQIENPFQLCLHQRDFLAGSFITDNILEAVEKSRRTILLLSENFIKSDWCRFEFKAAHIQMMKDRCNRVIIIVLGEVPKDLDPDMKLYLTTNTFLKWDDKLFWEKLYFALPDKKS